MSVELPVIYKNESKNLMSQYALKEKKTRYQFLTSYLQYLIKKYVNLESEMILKVFKNQNEYHAFINREMNIDRAEKLCKQMAIFLKKNGYVVDSMNY